MSEKKKEKRNTTKRTQIKNKGKRKEGRTLCFNLCSFHILEHEVRLVVNERKTKRKTTRFLVFFTLFFLPFTSHSISKVSVFLSFPFLLPFHYNEENEENESVNEMEGKEKRKHTRNQTIRYEERPDIKGEKTKRNETKQCNEVERNESVFVSFHFALFFLCSTAYD